jgi:homoserine kinase
LQALFLPSETAALTIEYQGATPDRYPLDSSNLVLKALCLAAERLDARPPGGHVLVESQIPVGVGMGSSAAAVVAGLLLGARYAGKEVNDEQLLRWAEEIEGHIDNAAAAYHGGLVLALCNNVERVVTAKASFPEDIRLVLVTPAMTVATHEARQVLPKSYERADVLHTLQRTAILAATCFSGRFELFPELFDDKLHHPYRQGLVPGMERCLRLRHEGLLGVAISGSGSSVIAFAVKNDVQVGQALKDIFAEEGISSEVLLTSADNNGAWVTREAAPLGQILHRVGRVK